jgi:hypothetical protein
VRTHYRSLRNHQGMPLTPEALSQHKHVAADLRRGAILLNIIHSPPVATLGYEGPRLDSLAGVTAFQTHGTLCGVEFHPNGASALVTEYWRGEGALSEISLVNGQRRFVCSLGHISGSETPQLSADGQWCVINTHPNPQVVEISTGRHFGLAMPGANLDWWPSRGPGALLVVTVRSGRPELGLLDLSSGRYCVEGPITLPSEATGLPALRLHLSYPRVSADGRYVLVGTSIGPSPEFQERNGSRDRVAILDTQSLRLQLLASTFADSTCLVQRVHSSWAWTRTSFEHSAPGFTLHYMFATSIAQRGDDPAPEPTPSGERSETLILWR